jgi:hypothetical protein
MKKLIGFIFVLLFIGSTSATLLLLHPPKIEFSGNANEKICQTISVFSDYKGNLIAKIKWTDKKDSKNLNDYNLNSSKLEIINDFSEKIVSNNDQKDVEICLTFEKSGEYYGALLYNTETSPAGVGIWVYANIKGSNYNLDLSNFKKITGNTILKIKEIVKDSKNQKGLLVSSTTLLLFILFILLLFVEKRIDKNEKPKQPNTESKNESSK